jgi:anti-sigma regulatory factor (Ser/Thr protein kinase)
MMASRESQPGIQRIDAVGPTALGDAVAATRRFASEHELGTRDRAHLCIIVEELVANLFDHGDRAGDRRISVQFDRRDSAIALVIEDDGPAFDPRSAAANGEVPARGGGAGLRLVEAWSNVVGYESRDGGNRLDVQVPLIDS